MPPRSRTAKAARRAEDYEADIRCALADGDPRAALRIAAEALRSELAKMLRRRAGDGAYTGAQLAAVLLATAGQLATFKPDRPRGAPAQPGPADLIGTFTRALDGARQEGDSHG